MDFGEFVGFVPDNHDPAILSLYSPQENKLEFSAFLEKECQVRVHLSCMFDAHVRRTHEYARQVLSRLRVLTLYNYESPRVLVLGPRLFPLQAGGEGPVCDRTFILSINFMFFCVLSA